MRTLPHPRRSLPAVALALAVALSGCGDENGTATPDPTPTADASETPDDGAEASGATETAEPAASGRVTVEVGSAEVSFVHDPGRFSLNPTPPRAQLLPLDRSDGSRAERWGDIILSAPTRIYDPKSQKTSRLPADPVSWLRDHPDTKIFRERALRVMGQPAVAFDLKRSGAELFGDEDGGVEGDGFERYVLWQAGSGWFIAQASTFRGTEGLLEKDMRRDVFVTLLESLRLESDA